MPAVSDRGKGELAEALRRVPGWLGDDEAWALHEAVRERSSKDSPFTVVEIGSWQGRSTIAIARGMRAGAGGILYAIDPHSDTALHESTGVADTYEGFLRNIRDAGIAPLVRPVRACSADARPAFAVASVDVLFVDGSHAYRDVVRDIDDWASALADVATVAFHDAAAYPGVQRALTERVLRPGSFRKPRLVESTLFVDFRRIAPWTREDGLALRRFLSSERWG
jgi:Methyltransferase domain